MFSLFISDIKQLTNCFRSVVTLFSDGLSYISADMSNDSDSTIQGFYTGTLEGLMTGVRFCVGLHKDLGQLWSATGSHFLLATARLYNSSTVYLRGTDIDSFVEQLLESTLDYWWIVICRS